MQKNNKRQIEEEDRLKGSSNNKNLKVKRVEK